MPDNQKIFDEILDDALKIFRVAANQKQISFQRLEKLKKQLVAKFATEELNATQKGKLTEFFKATDAIIGDAYRQLELELDLPEISSLAAEQTAASLEVAMGENTLKLPTKHYHNSVASNVLIQGAPSKAWWQKQAAGVQFAFTNQVRQGLTNGETNQQIISRIVGKAGQPGIMDVARRNAAALVQTSVQAVANDARRATFDANSDVIKGIKQVSTLDGRTSLTCISYSDKEWNLERQPIGHSMPFNGGCPRHFNCRSIEVPITKTFRELGVDTDEAKLSTRASSEGQIDADTGFAEFLNRRGKAYQDKMLGPGRADLWREGKITLRDLVDGNGRPLSVTELRNTFGLRKPPLTDGFFSEAYVTSLPKAAFQPFDNWEDLVTNGELGLKQFNGAMDNVAKKLGLRTDLKPDSLTSKHLSSKEGFLFKAPLKGFERSMEKVTKDYRGDWTQLNDVVRGTISVNSLDEVKAAIDAMRAEGIDFISRPKDRFLNPVVGGYRDLLGLVRLPNGMNAEVQFHVKGMTAAKNKGHKFYREQREIQGKYGPNSPITDPKDLARFNQVVAEQTKIYEAAWQAILEGSELK